MKRIRPIDYRPDSNPTDAIPPEARASRLAELQAQQDRIEAEQETLKAKGIDPNVIIAGEFDKQIEKCG